MSSETRTGFAVKVLVAMAMAAGSALADDDPGVKAWGSSAIAVDVRRDACRAVGQTDIGYSPKWCGVTNAGAYVVLQKVVNGVTNTIATLTADEESEYRYTFEGEASPFVKFIHRVYSSDGVEVAEPLVRDMAFGYRSAEGGAFVADSRTNSLQIAAANRDPIMLAYSTAWATNAASVSIRAVALTGQGGTATATNAVFSAEADAEGYTPLLGAGRGWWRLLCQVKGEEGDTLFECLTEEFKMPGGFLMNIR